MQIRRSSKTAWRFSRAGLRNGKFGTERFFADVLASNGTGKVLKRPLREAFGEVLIGWRRLLANQPLVWAEICDADVRQSVGVAVFP